MSSQPLAHATTSVLTRADDLLARPGLARPPGRERRQRAGRRPGSGWARGGRSTGPRRWRSRCLRVDEGGELVGLAPLLSRRTGIGPACRSAGWNCWPRRARAGTASARTTSTRSPAAAGRPPWPAPSWSPRAGRLGAWDELVIPLMDGEGLMPGLLQAPRGRAAGTRPAYETTRAPFIALPGDMGRLSRGLDKKDRYLVNRSLRRLRRVGGGAGRLRRATDAREPGGGQAASCSRCTTSARSGTRAAPSARRSSWRSTTG